MILSYRKGFLALLFSTANHCPTGLWIGLKPITSAPEKEKTSACVSLTFTGALTRFSHIKPSPSEGKVGRQKGNLPRKVSGSAPITHQMTPTPGELTQSRRVSLHEAGMGQWSGEGMPGPLHRGCHHDVGMLPLPQPSQPGCSCSQPSPPHLWGLSLVVWDFFPEDAPNQNQI